MHSVSDRPVGLPVREQVGARQVPIVLTRPPIRPNNINVHFDSLPYNFPYVNEEDIGKSIKDYQDGAQTEMKSNVETRAGLAKAQFDEEMATYTRLRGEAIEKANIAKEDIKRPRKQLFLAVAGVAIGIVGLVGVTVAVVATQMWPLVFIAIPLVGLIVPLGYFTLKIGRIVADLRKVIEAPKSIPVPQELKIEYNPKKDLDLKSTREEAKKSLLKGDSSVFTAGWTDEEIVNYALLDKPSQNTNQHKYSLFLAARNHFGYIQRQNKAIGDLINADIERCNNELSEWVRLQKQQLAPLEEEIKRLQVAQQRGRPDRHVAEKKAELEQLKENLNKIHKEVLTDNINYHARMCKLLANRQEAALADLVNLWNNV